MSSTFPYRGRMETTRSRRGLGYAHSSSTPIEMSRDNQLPRQRISPLGELPSISEHTHTRSSHRPFLTPPLTQSANRGQHHRPSRSNSAPRHSHHQSHLPIPMYTPRSTLTPGPMFPKIPPYSAHNDQVPPTPTATRLLTTLLPRPISSWTLADFTTSNGPDGLSTLISLFVDFTSTRNGSLTSEHRGLIARRACITHPARLLNMMNSGNSLDDYILRSSTMVIPPLLEDQLCPARTSDLVANDGLRARIHDQTLTRGDLLQIILPYAQQLYSADSGLPAVIRQMTFQEIFAIVYTPGTFRRDLRARGRATYFNPPSWFNLHPAPAPTSVGGMETPLHLIPLMHMGVSLSEFCALPSTEQKSMALTALPSYLADKLPPATVLQALITIGQTDPTEVLPLLQPTAFHALLDLPPPAQAAPHVTHRYHLVFKHFVFDTLLAW